MTGTLKPLRGGRRALVLSVLAGVFFAAVLGFGAGTANAAYSASVKNGVLQVTGNSASDKLAIRLGSPTTIALDVGDDGTTDFSFDRSTFTAINVDAGGGDDSVRIDQSGGLFTDEAVTLNGGNGDDTLIGGDGADTLIGGGGDDFADGNRGNDTALLGSGNDAFQWDPGDGSDIVEGQGGGNDQLDFNGSNVAEKIDVSANGSRVRFTRDIASIVMDLAGIEHVHFRALGGADTVNVGDLAGTDTKTVDVDLSGSSPGGDGSADTVIANGTPGDDALELDNSTDGALVVDGLAAETTVLAQGQESQDTLKVAGLAGDDTLTAGVGLTGAMQATFDGGDDADTTLFNGSSADDTIGIALNGGAAAAFGTTTPLVNSLPSVESLVVSGLGGDDTIQGQNGLSLLGTPALTIDGGNGDDTIGGGDGADLLLGGSGNDVVDGNRGADTAFLGSGNDHFVWDPGDGSDVIEGQGGNDQLDFNGSNVGEKIEVAANGSRGLLTRDVANIVQDFDGIEHVAIRALGGVDTITVDNLAGTDIDSVDTNLAGFDGNPDGSADTVVVNGTDKKDVVNVSTDGSKVSVDGLRAETTIVGSEPTDTLRVQTQGGKDSVTVDPGVSTLITPVVDLGPDQ